MCVFEVQSAIRPDSPLSEEAVVEVRIPVSREGDVRECAEGVDKNVVSVDMATTNDDDCFAHKTNARTCMCNKENVRAVRCCLCTPRRVHGSFDDLNVKLKRNNAKDGQD